MLLPEGHAAAGCREFFLDLILAGLIAAPHGLHKAGSVVEDILQLRHIRRHAGVGVSVGAGALQHILLHLFQDLVRFFLQLLQAHLDLFTGIPSADHAAACLDILGADLHADRDAAHLLLGEFPSGALVRIVHLHPEAAEAVAQSISHFQNALFFLLDGDDHDLHGRYSGRKHQAGVVAVHHDDRADETGGHTPGGLVHIFQLIVLIRELDAEGFGKAISEIVAGAGLQSLSVVHQSLNGIGSLRSREFFLIRLLSPDDGHRKHLFAEVRVQVQHLDGALLRLLHGGVGGVSLLPQELSGAQEGSGLLLPAYHGAPLVIYLGQVTVGVDIVLVKIAEKRLGRGPHAQTLLQLRQPSVRHPGYLRGKALHMILFLLKKAFRNEHGHIDIFHARFLEPLVQLLLDQLPDRVAVGLDRHAALHARILDQLRLLHHVGVPLGEILIHGCDRFHQFLFCHCFLHSEAFLAEDAGTLLFLKIKNRRFPSPGQLPKTAGDRKAGGTTPIDMHCIPALFPLTPGPRRAARSFARFGTEAPRPVRLLSVRAFHLRPSLWERKCQRTVPLLRLFYVYVDIREFFGDCQPVFGGQSLLSKKLLDF